MEEEKVLIDLESLRDAMYAAVQKIGVDRLFIDDIIELIENANVEDAVKVVRCKDCKNHHWEQELCHGKDVHLCRRLKVEVARDFYCAYGKRKTNEGS